MERDELAREQIEAARRRAREAGPRRERLPEPTELPPLVDSPLEGEPAEVEKVGDSIPESYLYTPSDSPDVWLDIWQRDVRFPFASHRGPLGWLIVKMKGLLAPLWRAPLSDGLHSDHRK